TQLVTIPALAVVRVEATAPIAPIAAVVGPRTYVQARSGGTWTTARGVSVVVAVSGLASLAVGAYFGVQASELAGRADARCPIAACADPEALRWSADARTDARTANLLYIGGGVGLVTATILWLAGAPHHEMFLVPTAGPDQVGLAFTGRL
ncbi:MAG: hypothetical protein NT062_01355, partial [Proteobacteria bacterium]|nr:hypothetical protein [Pseudomonadota bacterium]